MCAICLDARRDHALICVVEQPVDLISLERTHEYRGLYHVLGGSLSPLDGVEPEHLRIDELLRRVERNGVQEVVLATNPNMTGEATAAYLADRLRGTRARHAPRERPARGRRPRVRRRGDAGPRPRRTPRDVTRRSLRRRRGRRRNPGPGDRRRSAPATSGRGRRRAREGARAVTPPDRAEQRRHPHGRLLRARVAQGTALHAGTRAPGRVLRGRGHPVRDVRQGDRRGRCRRAPEARRPRATRRGERRPRAPDRAGTPPRARAALHRRRGPPPPRDGHRRLPAGDGGARAAARGERRLPPMRDPGRADHRETPTASGSRPRPASFRPTGRSPAPASTPTTSREPTGKTFGSCRSAATTSR